MNQVLPDQDGVGSKALGFWACWALVVGTMIGSGIFTLPAVLAPYGMLSLGGWLITAAGAVCIALTIGRLAARTQRSGGLYVYTHEAFGPLPGFLIAWGYWSSLVIGAAAIAIAFVGYLIVLVPALNDMPMGPPVAALALIWGLIFLALRGSRHVGIAQLVLTILKLLPLVLIVGVGFGAGDSANLTAPPLNTDPLPVALSATALITMWAFLGLETACLPAGDVVNPGRTIARATVIGTLCVTVVYVSSTLAVMQLIPLNELAQSAAPFADAARKFNGYGFSTWGPLLIALGALVATAGSANGVTFAAAQVMMAVADDKLAPAFFARRNTAGAPSVALVTGGVVGSALLIANYSRGLMNAFTFLLMMSTLTTLVPFLVIAIAEVRHSWRARTIWTVVAVLAAAYAVFAIIGSGTEAIVWGVVLTLLGVPVFYWGRQKQSIALKPA